MTTIDAEKDLNDGVLNVNDGNIDSADPQIANGDETDDQAILEETHGVEEQSPSIELQFLSPDQRGTHHGDLLLAAVVEPEIEEDTEAAEALRANAQIKVGKVSKAARGINAQTVRKFVKVASLRGHGIKRGKPPRVPPGLAAAVQHQQPDQLVIDAEGNQIYAVKEEDDESGTGERSENSSIPPTAVQDQNEASTTNESEKIETSKSHQHVNNEDEVSKKSTKHHSLDGTKSSKPTKGHKGVDQDASATHDDHEGDIPKHVVAETMDVERKLMGELDPHNMLQVQRWRRKRRSGKKERKSYVKGKVIDGKHELYTLSIAVMLGVRTSIARTNTIISSSDGGRKKILSPQDFMAEEKYEFAPKVRENVVGIHLIWFQSLMPS